MTAFWDKIKSVAGGDDGQEDGKKKGRGRKGREGQVPEIKDAERVREKDKGAEAEKKAKQPEKKQEEPAQKKGKKKSKQKIMAPHEAWLVNRVLIRPKISEAAMNQQTLGKYVFAVSKDAAKSQIAHSVEAMYGVTVKKVNIIRYKPRGHGFKGVSGTKSGFKKAVVSLKQGESIDLFKEAK